MSSSNNFTASNNALLDASSIEDLLIHLDAWSDHAISEQLAESASSECTVYSDFFFYEGINDFICVDISVPPPESTEKEDIRQEDSDNEGGEEENEETAQKKETSKKGGRPRGGKYSRFVPKVTHGGARRGKAAKISLLKVRN